MNRKQILLSCLALCFCAAPANADLFQFGVDKLDNDFVFGTKTFTAVVNKTAATGSFGNVLGIQAPAESAFFFWNLGDAGDFELEMAISDITGGAVGDTATGIGIFTYTDAGGDKLTGDISGTWIRKPSLGNNFEGNLSNVLFDNTSGDGKFDGGAIVGGFVDMSSFNSPQPWGGTVVGLTGTSLNFFDASFTTALQGSVNGIVTPLPSALLLGILGLGTAGLRLRRRRA